MYKREYVDDLVKDWNSQLHMLSTVAESEPQAAYSAFVSGFKNKLSYFMRTIPDISNLLNQLKTPFEIDLYQQLQVDVYSIRKNASYCLYQLDMED